MINAIKLAIKIKAALDAESAKLYVPHNATNSRAYGCSVDGCRSRAYAKGLCNAHYIRVRQGKSLDAPIRRRGRKTSCVACGKPLDNKGGWSLCKMHYRHRRRRIIRRVCVEALGEKCVKCNNQFPDHVYDFHHLLPHGKDGSPSNMIDGSSIQKIAQEVAKCILLCANCHRIEHHGNELRERTSSDTPS